MKPDAKHPFPAGVGRVFLTSGYEEVEGPSGAAYRYIDSVQLDKAICAAVLQKPGRLNAEEILYLRLRADWRQEDLASRLHVSTQSVSLWERGHVRLQPTADLLLRVRFFMEAPRSKRPGFTLRNPFRHFDALVAQVRDYNFIAQWDNGWTVTYEPLATSVFEAEQASGIGDLIQVISAAMLGTPALSATLLESRLIAQGYAKRSPELKVALREAVSHHATEVLSKRNEDVGSIAFPQQHAAIEVLPKSQYVLVPSVKRRSVDPKIRLNS